MPLRGLARLLHGPFHELRYRPFFPPLFGAIDEIVELELCRGIGDLHQPFALQSLGSEDTVDQCDPLTRTSRTYQQRLVAITGTLNHLAIAHAERVHPDLPVVALGVLQEGERQAILRALDIALGAEQVRAAHGDQVGRPQVRRVVVATGRRLTLYADIHMAVLELRKTVTDLNRYLDVGAALFEAAQCRDQPGAGNGRGRADHQARLTWRLECGTRPGFFDDVKGAGEFVEQAASGWGELDALGVSLEQAPADLVLQPFDLLADGGRRHTQLIRCTFHAAGLAHLNERAEGYQRDRSAHPAYLAVSVLQVSQVTEKRL